MSPITGYHSGLSRRSCGPIMNFTVDDVGPFSSDVDPVKQNGSFVNDLYNHSLSRTEEEAETGSVAYLLSTDFCMSIHGFLIISIFTIGIIRSVGFFAMAIRSSLNMHDRMFKGLINVRKLL